MKIIVFDSGIKQPKDKGILLRDIIENGGNVTGGAFRGRNPENTSDRTPGAPTEQRLEINETGKSNALTSVSKDSLCVQIKEEFYKNRDARIYEEKCPTLRSDRFGLETNSNNLTWRKLTPIECERLQTVPDNYTNHVSNSQRYKMLGNGWTVDVIAHIFSFIKQQKP